MYLSHKKAFGLAVLGLGSLVAAIPATADTAIDTTSAWNGSSGVQPWGLGPVGTTTSTYGETITTPADHYLTNFTFYINTSNTINYQSYVYAWDGAEATGPALFSSAVQTTTPGAGYQSYTTQTGGLDLTPGSQYVLFSTTSGLQAGQPSGTSTWGYTGSNPYAGGQFQFANSEDNFSALTTQPWGSFGTNDLAFKANFAGTNPMATPEPSEAASIGFGVLGLSGLMLRARKRRAVSA